MNYRIYTKFLILFMIMRSHHSNDQWDLKTVVFWERKWYKKEKGYIIWMTGIYSRNDILYNLSICRNITCFFLFFLKVESTENLVSNIKNAWPKPISNLLIQVCLISSVYVSVMKKVIIEIWLFVKTNKIPKLCRKLGSGIITIINAYHTVVSKYISINRNLWKLD